MENKNVLVSVITPCYRMKEYLKLFLEELPKQTIFDKIEVVLDHNEPDEEEVKWVKDFQKKYPNRVKHIIVKKVDPIGVSMNRCIKESSGEYLAIWNVDDLRTPNSLELQVENIEKGGNDIAMGDFLIVRKFGEKNKGKRVEAKHIPPKEHLRSMWLGPFFMFKKSLCKNAGYFDEQLRSGADFDLAVRLASFGRVGNVVELLGYYLNEGKGASTRPDSKQKIEKTVIELRYGIFDKIDFELLPYTVGYSIPNLIFFEKSYTVKDFFSEYDDMIIRNTRLIKIALKTNTFETIFRLNKIKGRVKKQIKKYGLK